VGAGLRWGGVCSALPLLRPAWPAPAEAGGAEKTPEIRAVIREPVLFAGIRKPIQERAELEPRIAVLQEACAGRITGPLTHIFRFDTHVEGYDSEIGFPVSSAVDEGPIRTHELRRMHCYALLHEGSPATLRETSSKLYAYMNRTGLSPELELQEVYLERNARAPERSRIDVMASFLAWPELYHEQLDRVLGTRLAARIWMGGEALSPHTLVDERCAWVAASIARLKAHTDQTQQFEILSRVCLERPPEDVRLLEEVYEQEGDVHAVIAALQERLSHGRTGGFVDPPRYDGKVLHMSKVPRDGARYAQARTHEERRKAYCFCNLVREASKPEVDPIFCYRAAGWDRQLWEAVLGISFERCRITHSILEGDDFCAWDYDLTAS
jgi:effector-binding domain-containing protein